MHPNLLVSALNLTKDDWWTAAVLAWEAWIPHGLAIYIVGQVLLLKVLPSTLYSNNKATWKSIMTLYNVGMSVFSALTFVASLSVVLQHGIDFTQCGELYVYPVFQWAAYAFYVSKYVEFMDTTFLLLVGREVSWLQYFHHAFAPVCMWLLVVANVDLIYIFLTFNSFIHTWMYMYYAATINGWNVRHLRIVMTSMQIAQLVFGLMGQTWGIHRGPACEHTEPLHVIANFLGNLYVFVLVLLFGHFFLQNYVFGQSAAKPAARTGTKRTRGGDNGSRKKPSAKPKVH